MEVGRARLARESGEVLAGGAHTKEKRKKGKKRQGQLIRHLDLCAEHDLYHRHGPLERLRQLALYVQRENGRERERERERDFERIKV